MTLGHSVLFVASIHSRDMSCALGLPKSKGVNKVKRASIASKGKSISLLLVIVN
jgi:hypothetical protein